MTRNIFAVVVLLGLAGVAHAAETETAKVVPDPLVAGQLKQLDYEYEVDVDGDYKVVVGFDESERTQLVFIRSAVESYGKNRIREIWSYAYAGEEGSETLPALVANRLLDASNDLILGSWVKQSANAVFVAKIPADAKAETLRDAVNAAASTADEMELELVSDPNSDDF